jgi:hypothetical protein
MAIKFACSEVTVGGNTELVASSQKKGPHKKSSKPMIRGAKIPKLEHLRMSNLTCMISVIKFDHKALSKFRLLSLLVILARVVQ